jgi:hypothetical protein
MRPFPTSKSLIKSAIYLLISLWLIACSYENLEEKFQSSGVITGRDLRLCPSPCCGGWDITIDKSFYTFSSLPANSGIDLEKETFPLKVKLNWRLDSVCGSHIQILKIVKE